MSFLYLFVIGVLGVLNIVQTMHFIEHRRYYFRKDLKEIAEDRYSCKVLAEALEIDVPGEHAYQYVSWAIKEHVKRIES